MTETIFIMGKHASKNQPGAMISNVLVDPQGHPAVIPAREGGLGGDDFRVGVVLDSEGKIQDILWREDLKEERRN